jgi:hypothetical protein
MIAASLREQLLHADQALAWSPTMTSARAPAYDGQHRP